MSFPVTTAQPGATVFAGFGPAAATLAQALRHGGTPPCTDAELAVCIASAERARMNRVGGFPIGDQELLEFYRDYRADPGQESWENCMRRRAHAVYGARYQAPSGPAGPLAALPQASQAAPAPRVEFVAPQPEPEPGPRPLPMPDIDARGVHDPQLRHALDYLEHIRTGYARSARVDQAAQLAELGRRLGIRCFYVHGREGEWPESGAAGSELLNLLQRGAHFAGLPWSGPLTVSAMLAALSLRRNDGPFDPSSWHGEHAALLLACLKIALVDHDRECLEHERTYGALMQGDAGSGDLTPLRLVQALRSAYRHNRAERLALMHALAWTFGVALETGPARDPEELRQGVGYGFTSQHGPLMELRNSLRMLELGDLNLSECAQLANLCLNPQVPATAPAALRRRFLQLDEARDGEGRPWLDADQRGALARFLSELPRTAEWQARPDTVVALCDELFDPGTASASFLQRLAAIAADATVSCEDNVGFGLDRMRLLLRFQQAPNLPSRLEVLRQLYLQHLVMDETFRLYGGNAPNVDLLQRALRFMVDARQRGLLHDGGHAGTVHNTELGAADLQAVADRLARADEPGFMAFVGDSGWLAEDPELMDAHYRRDMAAIDQAAHEALEAAEDSRETQGETLFDRIAADRGRRAAAAMSEAVRRAMARASNPR